jgi:hypothetical protein
MLPPRLAARWAAAQINRFGCHQNTPQSLIIRLASPDATGRTEADIQSDIKTLLTTADFDLDTPRLEEQIGDGSRRRIDIATGATVIEGKRLTNETADADYINQLAGYVTTHMSQAVLATRSNSRMSL